MRTYLLSVKNVKSLGTFQDSKGNTWRRLKVEDEDAQNPVKISVPCAEGQTLAEAKRKALDIYISMQWKALERELAKIVRKDCGDLDLVYTDGDGWGVYQESTDFCDDGYRLIGRGVVEALHNVRAWFG